jgi:hypothetical protein
VLAAIAPAYVDYPFLVAGKFFGYYQYTQGKYYFAVTGENERNSGQPGWLLLLGGDSLKLRAGISLPIISDSVGNCTASLYPPPANSGEHLTTNNEKGEL